MGDKRNEMLSETAWSVIYYSACSSVLLVANKAAWLVPKGDSFSFNKVPRRGSS